MHKRQIKKTATPCPDKFMKQTLHESVMASNNIKDEDFNYDKARQDAHLKLNALNLEGGLQTMLAAQMLSIHQLQQLSMTMANGMPHGEGSRYFTNTAIKLANTFVQQATLLARLQGNGGQKIVVEHVEVHQGGHAIVGHIQGVTPSEETKK